jgi:hypothetical protein
LKTLLTATSVVVTALMLAGCLSMPLAKEDNIPSVVKAQLNGRFPNWHLHRGDPRALKFVRSKGLSDSPAVAHGDFNGDGQADVGLLIDEKQRCMLILAHRIEGSEDYRLYQFQEQADYILTRRKGTGGFDHNTGRGFTFPQDSVEANKFEQSARAYIFTNGKYYVAQTSD